MDIAATNADAWNLNTAKRLTMQIETIISQWYERDK